MKKLLSMIAAIALAVTLSACGAKFDAGAALKAVKNFDVEAMQQYYGDDIMDQLFAGAEKLTNDEAGIDKNHPLAKVLTKQMSYKITESVENEDGSVTVTAEITNWEAGKLYAEMAVKYLVNQNLDALYDEVTADAQTDTDTITFKMTNNGDNWRVAPADVAKIVAVLLF